MSDRLVAAMSGGVDSSVCALLMKEEGHDVVGMTMRLWKGEEAEAAACSSQSCCGAESVDDARLVCQRIGIPYFAINFREEFWREVVERFAAEYEAGRTPSPCILCNERLKFSTLYQKAVEIGASKVATGHYARIEYDAVSERWQLLRGIDSAKDQSYFLFSMTQPQLAKTLFPLGDKCKPEIREIAAAAGLATARKAESQDICFIPNHDYAAFLERHFPERFKGKKGAIRHVNGQLLGEHRGVHRVTIGQRKGLQIAFGEPLYVVGIDAEREEIVVGSREATARSSCLIERVNWITCEPKIGEVHSFGVKIRSRSPEASAQVERLEGDRARITFKAPQHAITPGQAAVFYDGEYVMGGGWISDQQDH